MRFSKKFFSFLLLGIIFSSLEANTLYSATFSRCVNQPTDLVWSSTGCSSGYSGGTVDELACDFTPSSSGVQSVAVDGSFPTCTVTFTCDGAVEQSATLNVDFTQIWNGSACVAPSCGGTAPTGGNYRSSPATLVGQSWSYAVSGACTWSCDSGYHQSGNSCVIDAPSVPTNFSASASTCGNPWINLSWTASVNATSYDVYRDGVLLFNTAVTAVSDVDVSSGETHSYTVLAKNAGGSSAQTGAGVATVSGDCVCSGTAPIGANFTSIASDGEGQSWTYAGSGGCTWFCDGGYHQSGNMCVRDDPVAVITPPSCVIPINQSSCNATISWTSANVDNIVLTDCSGTGVSYNGSGSGPGPRIDTVTIPYDVGCYQLHNGSFSSIVPPLTEEYGSSSCESGTSWSVTDNKCLPPDPVNGSTITNQYTSSEYFNIICSNSNQYSITKGGSIVRSVTAYVAPTTWNPVPHGLGTYVVNCIRSETGKFDPRSLSYENMPDPIVTLRVTPSTLSKGSTFIASWEIEFPGSVQVPRRTCKLQSAPVCTNNQCTTSQNTASTTMNAVLKTGNTDTNDAGNRATGVNIGPRNIQDSLNYIATRFNTRSLASFPLLGDPVLKATGQRTLVIDKTMDFEIDCGSGSQAKKKVRVNVTTSNEG